MFSRATLKFQDPVKFANAVESRTDIAGIGTAISAEYLATVSSSIKYTWSFINNNLGGLFGITRCILQNMPLFLFFAMFWNSCIVFERKKSKKAIFFFSMLLPVFSIPALMLFIDWGRWVAMLLTTQFMLAFYFLYEREPAVIRATNKFTAIVKKHIFVAALFLMLSIFFGTISWGSPSHNFYLLLDLLIGALKKIASFVK